MRRYPGPKAGVAPGSLALRLRLPVDGMGHYLAGCRAGLVIVPALGGDLVETRAAGCLLPCKNGSYFRSFSDIVGRAPV